MASIRSRKIFEFTESVNDAYARVALLCKPSTPVPWIVGTEVVVEDDKVWKVWKVCKLRQGSRNRRPDRGVYERKGRSATGASGKGDRYIPEPAPLAGPLKGKNALAAAPAVPKVLRGSVATAPPPKLMPARAAPAAPAAASKTAAPPKSAGARVV
eukprot:Skav218390  [mRNA]  locus=scaffold368:44802:46505:+ [translate_table: standard]